MPAPVYATLGNADRDESQEAIDLNIVDESGKHVDIGQPAAVSYDGGITSVDANIAQVSDTPTKAEIDAIVAAYNALAASYNALLAGMQEAGLLGLPKA